jgi:hypothetical protein
VTLDRNEPRGVPKRLWKSATSVAMLISVGIALTAAAPAAADSPAIPEVAELSPNYGPPAGGTAVTIHGVNFSGATAVAFGSSDAESFTVDSDSTITAVSPPKAQYWGVVDVTVLGPGGSSPVASQDRFGYGPIVDELTPRQGPAVGGTEVTIGGFGLNEATKVVFGASAAASFSVNLNGSITAISPPAHGGETVAPVEVTTPEGPSNTYTVPDTEPVNLFSFGPTVTAVEPSEVPESGGIRIAIHGSGFTSSPVAFRGLGGPFVHALSFGSTELHCGDPWPAWYVPCGAPSFTVISDSELLATVPPGTGSVDLRLTTEGGTSPATPSDRLTYARPAGVTKSSSRFQVVSCGSAKRSVPHRTQGARLPGKVQRNCTTRLISDPSASTGDLGGWTARLVRGDVLVARGTAHLEQSGIQMTVEPLRKVKPGRYRLTLSSGRGERHELIAIR